MTTPTIQDFIDHYNATRDARNKFNSTQIRNFYSACQRMTSRKAAQSLGWDKNTGVSLKHRMKKFGLNFPGSKKPDWAYGDNEYVAAPITLGGPEWSWPQYQKDCQNINDSLTAQQVHYGAEDRHV